jgi:hypothetical protein
VEPDIARQGLLSVFTRRFPPHDISSCSSRHLLVAKLAFGTYTSCRCIFNHIELQRHFVARSPLKMIDANPNNLPYSLPRCSSSTILPLHMHPSQTRD